MATIVPASGEVLVVMYPDYGVEHDDEEPYFLHLFPVAAWRIVDAGPAEREIWAEPILTAEADMPSEDAGTVITAYLLPNGKIYSSDGADQADSIEEFAERWRNFYAVKVRQRRDEESAAGAETGGERAP